MSTPFATTLFESRWISASPRVPRNKQKLMIVMHGMSDSLESFRDIDSELELPWMNYLILNAPDRFEDGFSWYKLEPRHASGVRRSRALLKRLLRALRAEGWRNSEIYLFGHSQGALMACDCLLTSDEPFAGVVGISGYVWFFKGWQRLMNQKAVLQTPWLMTYGTRDRVIPPEEIKEDLQTLWDAGVPVSARAFHKGHDFDFKGEIPFVRNWLEFVSSAVPSKRRVQVPSPTAALPLVSVSSRRSSRRILPFT